MIEQQPNESAGRMICVRCGTGFSIPEPMEKDAYHLCCIRCGRHTWIRSSAVRKYFSSKKAGSGLPETGTLKKKPAASRSPVTWAGNPAPRKYELIVEHLAGTCVCGSVFRFSGKPRCPCCRSTVLRVVTEDPLSVLTTAGAGRDRPDPGAVV